MSPMYKQNIGRIGQQRAVEFLRSKNYQILQQNFRTKFGEIDIIAIYENELVFVEVKCRTSIVFGQPYEAVNRRKLFQIIRAGQIYRFKNKNLPEAERIAVVSILLSPGGEVESVELLSIA